MDNPKSSFGINRKIESINIIEIAPISINSNIWYCLGFEPDNTTMHDHFHLCLVRLEKPIAPTKDLLKGIQRALSGNTSLLRIHSECILGDVFSSDICDCGAQLTQSLNIIEQHNSGIIIYLRQEGRGIGLRAKLSCLSLQEGYRSGLYESYQYTPDEANIKLGFDVDQRNYDVAAKILKALKVSSAKIITGNLDKVSQIESAGIEVVEFFDINRDIIYQSERQKIEIQQKLKRNYVYDVDF